MILRAVYVNIAPGRTDDYWAWTREILALWDAHGIRRHGGPYRGHSDGSDTAVWLTLHESDEDAREEFRVMYSTDEGRELLARRPPLVEETTMATYTAFDE